MTHTWADLRDDWRIHDVLQASDFNTVTGRVNEHSSAISDAEDAIDALEAAIAAQGNIMSYRGSWNASTNSPSLTNGTGDAGDVYIVGTAGSRNFGAGSITFAVGDYVIYSGTVWQKLPFNDLVVSVAGLTGAISASSLKTALSLVASDVGLGNVSNTSDATKWAASAALTNKDLTSGTNTFPTFNQNTTGSAATLTTGRTFQTNLASTSAVSFNGSANVTPGVTGILPVANGGTGVATLTGIVKASGTSAFAAAVAGTDYVAPGGALGTPSSGTLTNCTFPTLNQNTTGSAATLTTGRTFQTDLASTSAVSFNGSANNTHGVTGTLPVSNGGSGATSLTGLLVGNGTSAFTAVSAPSGAVVGTTDAQAFTNKTINLTSNTLTGTTAQFNAALTDDDFATKGGVANSTEGSNIAPAWGQTPANYTIGGGASWSSETTLAIVNGSTLSFSLAVVSGRVYSLIPTFSAALTTGTWSISIGSDTTGWAGIDYWYETTGRMGLVAPSTGTVTVAITFTSLGSLNLTNLQVKLVSQRAAAVAAGCEFRSVDQTDTNTALGYNTLLNSVSGNNSVAIGHRALEASSRAGDNTAVGAYALRKNTTGTSNTAIGRSALAANTVGQSNVAVGDQALAAATKAFFNTAVGYAALAATTTGTTNSALGTYALAANTTGANNCAFGQNSLPANTTGGANAAFGRGALSLNTTGTGNTALGYGAGNANGTTSNGTAIGANTVIGAGHTYSVALGADATTTAANQVEIGARHIELYEQSDPGNGAANSARLFAVDDGSGTTQLAVRLSAGNAARVGLKVDVPSTASSAGAVGQWAADANYHYDCIAPNTWVRSVAATW